MASVGDEISRRPKSINSLDQIFALTLGGTRASMGILIDVKTCGGLLSGCEKLTEVSTSPESAVRADPTDPCTIGSAPPLWQADAGIGVDTSGLAGCRGKLVSVPGEIPMTWTTAVTIC